MTSKLIRASATLKQLMIATTSAALLGAVTLSTAQAGSAEQAKRIHDRLAGVPPTKETLDAMTQLITDGDQQGAAELAVEHPGFYNVTLKNLATPWTNEEQTLFAELNDYSATVIGMVRDDVDFRELLYGNILYTGASSTGAPAYSNSNNLHFAHLDNNDVDLKTGLVRRTQTEITGLAEGATAGVMTTRAAAKAFFKDGTNRAMFRFTLLNHLCVDLEQVKDNTRPSGRIRQDVSRSPGGDSRIFLNNCLACHSGMDPMAQAFAYYEYLYDGDADPDGLNGQLTYNSDGQLDAITGSRVTAKHHINENNFKYGYVIPDDRWDNYWRAGPNRGLGWSSSLTGGGNGAKSMGQELAHSNQFAQCQVERVFETVCLRPVQDAADQNQVESMVTSFTSGGYRLKQVFIESALYCKGE